GGVEIASDIVLFADENELARGPPICVSQKMLGRQFELVQAERGEPFGGRHVRIEIVFVQIAACHPHAFAIAANNETRAGEQNRYDQIGDYIIEPSHLVVLSSDKKDGRCEPKTIRPPSFSSSFP